MVLVGAAFGFLIGTIHSDDKWHDRFEESFRDYEVYRQLEDMTRLDTYCRIGVEEGWILLNGGQPE